MTPKRIVFLCAAVMLAAPRLWAQGDSSPEYVEARQRLQEGKALYQRSDIDGARLKFEQACAVLKTPACQRALGLSQFYTKRYLEALSNLQRALDDAELDSVQRKQVTDLMQQAYDKTGHLEIRAPAGAHVRIDDTVDAGNAPLHDNVHVTIGSHTISVQVDDKTERKTIECAEGKVVKVDFADRFPGLQTGGGGGPETPKTERVRTTVGWVVPIVVGAVGAVGIGLGAGFAAASQSAQSDATKLFAPGVCADLTTQACMSYKSKIDAQNSSTAASIVGYAAGAALLTTAVILFVVWPKKERVVVVPAASPSSMGVSLVGTF